MPIDEDLEVGETIPIEETLPWMAQPESARKEEAEALYEVLTARFGRGGQDYDHKARAREFVNRIYSSDYFFEN